MAQAPTLKAQRHPRGLSLPWLREHRILGEKQKIKRQIEHLLLVSIRGNRYSGCLLPGGYLGCAFLGGNLAVRVKALKYTHAPQLPPPNSTSGNISTQIPVIVHKNTGAVVCIPAFVKTVKNGQQSTCRSTEDWRMNYDTSFLWNSRSLPK